MAPQSGYSAGINRTNLGIIDLSHVTVEKMATSSTASTSGPYPINGASVSDSGKEASSCPSSSVVLLCDG